MTLSAETDYCLSRLKGDIYFPVSKQAFMLGYVLRFNETELCVPVALNVLENQEESIVSWCFFIGHLI